MKLSLEELQPSPGRSPGGLVARLLVRAHDRVDGSRRQGRVDRREFHADLRFRWDRSHVEVLEDVVDGLLARSSGGRIGRAGYEPEALAIDRTPDDRPARQHDDLAQHGIDAAGDRGLRCPLPALVAPGGGELDDRGRAIGAGLSRSEPGRYGNRQERRHADNREMTRKHFRKRPYLPGAKAAHSPWLR